VIDRAAPCRVTNSSSAGRSRSTVPGSVKKVVGSFDPASTSRPADDLERVRRVAGDERMSGEAALACSFRRWEHRPGAISRVRSAIARTARLRASFAGSSRPGAILPGECLAMSGECLGPALVSSLSNRPGCRCSPGEVRPLAAKPRPAGSFRYGRIAQGAILPCEVGLWIFEYLPDTGALRAPNRDREWLVGGTTTPPEAAGRPPGSLEAAGRCTRASGFAPESHRAALRLLAPRGERRGLRLCSHPLARCLAHPAHRRPHMRVS